MSIDSAFDVETVTSGSRLGWLINMHPATWTDPETNVQKSALCLYFIQEDGVNFRVELPYNPYFYVSVKEGHTREVEHYLRKKYDRHIANVLAVQKQDLDLKNHLAGLTKTYLRVSFLTVQSLLHVRNELMPLIKKNKEHMDTTEAYEDPFLSNGSSSQQHDGMHPPSASKAVASDYLVDIREYDIPYYTRVSIDLGIRVGLWYTVHVDVENVRLEQSDLPRRPEARVLAFDIETTKLHLKFPDPTIDSIMMISYMLDGQGFLIINREIVSEDIEDFEYTPKPEYEGKFEVHNEPDEKSMLERFFQHIRKAKPNIIVTYNGDFFDWPFVEARAKTHSMNFQALSGVREDQGEYKGHFVSHLDAFEWVRRDSYLPQGSQGLKAVTRNKLGYDPLELDPEDMVRFASEQPQTLASYSVSDAVATYYLYMIYIHPFIFSLCTIIPMNPHDVLRKGSGTLCESLLMAEAIKENIVFPNKYVQDPLKTFHGHLLESETYVGGHVESLESGVFRDDLEVKFNTTKTDFDELVDDIDHVLDFAIIEGGLRREEITNYDQVKDALVAKLDKFRTDGVLRESPAIYHVDVAAMYPNIILTNRLQPSAIVNQETCASCDFNRPENKCQRVMEWEWRGDYVPANSSEYRRIKEQLEAERFPTGPHNRMVPFADLPQQDQIVKLKGRLKEYSRKVYKKTHTTKNLVRSDTVCMRENSFYVDTVRDFRDRRYTYKDKHKEWKGRQDKAQTPADMQACQEMVVLYESLQLAHKCILNSFYGYVMRKGARWYSMEMAGIVTYTGAKIIREARETVEKIGRPLELDTDGIWCILPSSFPQNFTFTTSNPGKREFRFSYPIMLLNTKVADKFTNDQYQTLSKTKPKTYDIRSECSILFEMDGPYKAIVLPAAREQDVKLKKRYAVFNKNGTIAELKGFEIKRRGELKLVKDFQAQVFAQFLKGTTLEETYASVASVANHYLDVLDSQGGGMEDDELIDLITESSNMSRKLTDYQKQRSCAITTAKRLAEFLGDQMVKEKGLACSFIISKKPAGMMVTDRAIPVAIFSTDAAIQRRFLAQWLKTPTVFSLRDIVDWDYYRARLANSVQKIITIPAALQKVLNPVPRIPHPDWLTKSLRTAEGQRAITDIFQRRVLNQDNTDQPGQPHNIADMEDVAGKPTKASRPVAHSRKRDRIEMESLPPLPDGERPPKEDYKGLLEYQKSVWKHQREQRKRIRADPNADHTRRSLSGAPTTMSSYLSHQTAAILKSDWHVVQIRPTFDPGLFVLWALSGDVMFKIHLSVPRTYYINMRGPNPPPNGQRASVVPPRSKGGQHVMRYTLAESEFQSQAKSLALDFTHPSIEGVYELNVPLLWRPLIDLGCVCRLTHTASRGNFRDTYSLEDLVPSTAGHFSSFHSTFGRAASGYLGKENVKHLYVYHSASEGRGALFAVVRPQQGKGTVFLVNAHTMQGQTNTLLKPLNNKHPTITFELVRASSIDEAHKALQAHLAELARARGVTVLLLQSPRNGTQLAKSVPALDEFPRVAIPSNAADNDYPPLNWELQTTKALAHRFASVNAWWTQSLQLARYANLPVGNLEGDLTLLTSDVFFARQLKEAQHLLWMSSSNLPDLGGSEEDDAVFSEELINPELSEPGFYHPFCVEFDVFNLAINTVLEASHIGDIEGGSGLLAFEEDSHNSGLSGAIDGSSAGTPKTYDQSSICTNEFKVLRKLITRWSVDVTSSDAQVSACADGLLSQFYRWVSTPHALLYDPAIHKLIHDLMRKVFMQLMLEFRRFGAKTIFANYNKIIIATNKESLEDATAYSAYILAAIKKKDLFAWIDIKPVKFWENLFWMDRANFGGVEDMANEKIVSHWNIADYLPKAIQEYFLITITDYMLQTYKAYKAQPRTADAPDTTPSNQPDDFDEHNNGRPNSVVANLTPRLFAIIQDIQRTLSGDHSQANEASSEFPKLAGSHLPMNNPALEFIKFVCHVLSLDRTLEQDVNRLKKNLLRLINVREFASEATFANPCLSYVLPDHMCEFCNYGRDLDLLRDAPTSASASGVPSFACTSCGHPYNRKHMEATLVETVQKRDLGYQLQDLVCAKCRSVKAANMGDICTQCSGQWVCKVPLHAFKKSMMVFKNIAEFYHFDWLLEVVNTCTSFDT